MTKPQNIIAQIDKNVKKKQWKCIVDNCHKTAINSHLIQQNGILNNITVNGHLVELKMVDAYKWSKAASPIDFKTVGITQALSYKIFCNTHDTEIFQPIENKQADFESYSSFLLFSYRAVCAEIRKKEIAIEKLTRIVNANTLTGIIDKEPIKLSVKGNETGIKDLVALKHELEKEIYANKKEYTFFAFNYPKIDIYASAAFSANDISFTNQEEVLDLENIYIHILPLEDETLILVGYHNNYTSERTIQYCKSWENLTAEKLEFKLTELFSTNIENWGTSPKLFNGLKEKNKRKYIKVFGENVSYFGINQITHYNLFEK